MKHTTLLIFFLLLNATIATAREPVLTGDECVQAGGKIINTLDGSTCGADDQLLGKVSGMRCPCVCCKGPEISLKEFQELCETTGGVFLDCAAAFAAICSEPVTLEGRQVVCSCPEGTSWDPAQGCLLH